MIYLSKCSQPLNSILYSADGIPRTADVMRVKIEDVETQDYSSGSDYTPIADANNASPATPTTSPLRSLSSVSSIYLRYPSTPSRTNTSNPSSQAEGDVAVRVLHGAAPHLSSRPFTLTEGLAGPDSSPTEASALQSGTPASHITTLPPLKSRITTRTSFLSQPLQNWCRKIILHLREHSLGEDWVRCVDAYVCFENAIQVAGARWRSDIKVSDFLVQTLAACCLPFTNRDL
jgi:hypothetical protein